MKFKVMVFLADDYFITSGETPEHALSKLEKLMNASLVSWHKECVITYRPVDMLVFCNGNHIPCGVIINGNYL